MMLKQVLDMLACPIASCHGGLTLASDEKSLKCKKCGKVYEVKDGIPILLVEEKSN